MIDGKSTATEKKGAAKKAARKKAAVKRAAAKPAMALAMTSSAPTQAEVRDELTAFWDAFSPLSLNAVRAACDAGQTLDDIGLTEEQAQAFVNKYNSIVLRVPGKGPLVRSTEAKQWLTSPMPEIVKTVSQRAEP